MPEFYIMFDRKIFSWIFFLGGGGMATPFPISYAYGWAPGPHQLNPALIHTENIFDTTLTLDTSAVAGA